MQRMVDDSVFPAIPDTPDFTLVEFIAGKRGIPLESLRMQARGNSAMSVKFKT